nr:hypothetical protein HmN_000227300 [Hymenolepis microstoma]
MANLINETRGRGHITIDTSPAAVTAPLIPITFAHVMFTGGVDATMLAEWNNRKHVKTALAIPKIMIITAEEESGFSRKN